MNIGPAGLALIKEFEQCRLTAYKDGGGVWTIGWGHTGPEVVEGVVWTQAKADAVFQADIEAVVRDVASLVTVEVTQQMFDALCSFAYNCGTDIDADTKAEGLGDSTLLKLLNAGDWLGAAREFPKWNKDNGVEVRGLTRRRLREQALFLSV